MTSPAEAAGTFPLTLLAKALLVDVDPRARWADALARSATKPSDGNAPERPAPSGRGEQARVPDSNAGP